MKKNKRHEDDFQTIHQYDNEHWLHPWENLDQLGRANRLIITHAHGIYLYDERGKAIIDGQAGMWCVQVGYGRLDMAETIFEQSHKMHYMSPFYATSVPSAKLAHKLADLAPGDLNHVFFTSGGSTAVDSALRFVTFYNQLKHRPHKKHIISLLKSYHGSTYLSALVSARDATEPWFKDKASYVHYLPSADWINDNKGLSEEEYRAKKIREFKEKIRTIGPENVAAFIAEPVQASGGIVVHPRGYLYECKLICEEHDILYISDEVVTGFGRLGHWFSSLSMFNVQPDIITCAKGLSSGYVPIGAVLISDRLIRELDKNHGRDMTYNQGFTYAGHPVCCAAALKNIEIIEDEKILTHVQDISPYFQQQLHTLEELSGVLHVHGIGLLGAVRCHVDSMDDSLFCQLVVDQCLEAGLFIRTIQGKIFLSPPLIISKEEIDTLFSCLRQGIERALNLSLS